MPLKRKLKFTCCWVTGGLKFSTLFPIYFLRCPSGMFRNSEIGLWKKIEATKTKGIEQRCCWAVIHFLILLPSSLGRLCLHHVRLLVSAERSAGKWSARIVKPSSRLAFIYIYKIKEPHRVWGPASLSILAKPCDVECANPMGRVRTPEHFAW